MGRPKLQLPLPTGFFRCPPLSDNTRRHFIYRGQMALLQLVEKTRLRGGPIHWVLDHESHGVSVYRGVDLAADAVVYLRVMDIRATADDAARVMRPLGSRCDLADEHLADAQTLYVLADPTSEHPHNHVRLKWHAVAPKWLPLRDFCVVEYHDDVYLNGERGFGRVQQSVDIPWVCPAMDASYGVTRGNVSLAGDVFIPNPHRPGYVTLYRLEHLDLRVPSAMLTMLVHWSTKSALTKHMHALHDVFRRTEVGACWPERARVSRCCAVCHTRFSVIRPTKRTCQRCGEVRFLSCGRLHTLPRCPFGPWPRNVPVHELHHNETPRSGDDDDAPRVDALATVDVGLVIQAPNPHQAATRATTASPSANMTYRSILSQPPPPPDQRVSLWHTPLRQNEQTIPRDLLETSLSASTMPILDDSGSMLLMLD
ncbi:Aste57867_8492 [Aphanomyces stellatus]|uniref:Aste57867_8492 protein n=1 Tax=Aphanomyces stellatus TaxID=120398 RepID=A0A485KKI7_9STRA|nr:hypothetical protein As57867_008460 [Aphanomyces stellatus]VFT85378.1 Aste57867_8492 [Aphanomyces stellatus]